VDDINSAIPHIVNHFPIGGTLLSHIVTVKTEVRDHAAVAAACSRLALPEPVQGTAHLYSGELSGLIVNLPDWLYPVVIDTATGNVRYDNFEGCWGDEKHLHRFVQAYVVERSRSEARKKSYASTEQSLADGSILVEIEVGGPA
jgi:hypothetical protein